MGPKKHGGLLGAGFSFLHLLHKQQYDPIIVLPPLIYRFTAIKYINIDVIEYTEYVMKSASL